MKIAFIGLGNMGSGTASCIQRAGYDLTVWNRTGAKGDPLVTMGAKRAASAIVEAQWAAEQRGLVRIRAEQQPYPILKWHRARLASVPLPDLY